MWIKYVKEHLSPNLSVFCIFTIGTLYEVAHMYMYVFHWLIYRVGLEPPFVMIKIFKTFSSTTVNHFLLLFIDLII